MVVHVKKSVRKKAELESIFSVPERNFLHETVEDWDEQEKQNSCSPFIAIDWSKLADGVDPSCGELSPERAERKRIQCSAFLQQHILPVLQPGQTCVEFGSGSGHLGILLACLRPDCQVILVERKEYTTNLARQRIARAQLTNCKAICADIDTFAAGNQSFDLAISLHSCGYFTDMILELCIKRCKAFVLCPCCYGQVALREIYPRSACMRDLGFSPRDYDRIARSADFKVKSGDWNPRETTGFHTAKRCMRLIDLDRLSWCNEQSKKLCSCGFFESEDEKSDCDTHYLFQLSSLLPLNCSPKNNIISGVPMYSSNGVQTAALKNGLVKKLHKSRIAFDFNPDQYQNQLNVKITSTIHLLRPFLSTQCNFEVSLFPIVLANRTSNFSICKSPTQHFRLRCRFALIKCINTNKLSYAVWENGSPITINKFPVASSIICKAMPLVLPELEKESVLVNGIEAIHYMSTSSANGSLLITLIYSVPISENAWIEKARKLKFLLTSTLFHDIATDNGRKCHIIGRSKGKKIVLDEDYVVESFVLERIGLRLQYKQVEGSFTNPNGAVNLLALDWIYSSVSAIIRSNSSKNISLLEMYCGNCNHTVALSQLFKNTVITAVELSKDLCVAAEFNLHLNDIQNVEVIQSDSQKISQKVISMSNNFEKDLDWQILIVDPPRAGVDKSTLKMMPYFDHIVYISCNPSALVANLNDSGLMKSHEVVKFAIFDQFAYTPHVECGVYLKRRDF